MNKKHNPKLTKFSQRLRRELTQEERHLWYDFLKGLPVTIHRQKVIGQYIVDFYCASANLAIEIDGSQHCNTKGMETNAARDHYLNNLGLTVKRYSNTDINQDFGGVCLDIYNIIFPENI